MILDDVYAVIQERRRTMPAGSYVSSLLSRGKNAVLKKIGEEATEVVIAAKDPDRDQTIRELTDLWFHCLVLMAEDGITPADVYLEFESRFGTRGKE